MKKTFFLLILLVSLILGLTACSKKAENSKADQETCLHEQTLTSFVTTESEIPFAGVFTCKKCGKSEVKSFNYTDIEIPLVEISGDISEMTKENKVRAEIRYESEALAFSQNATLKWQGDTSIEYPKKNYSVTLFDESFEKKQKIVIDEQWGEQSKYCLKANYLDPSGARNLVLSDLYGDVARASEKEDAFSDLVNGGSVDGFFVLLYINGQYQGLYNWNIPKDKWLFGMGDDDAGEAVLCGTSILLNDENGISVNENVKDHWKTEYCNAKFNDAGSEAWAVASFNEMLAFVKASDAATLRERAGEYLNVERVLDVLLMALVFTQDNINNNLVWCTYDGKVWAPIMYDLDRTFGRDGSKLSGSGYFENFSDNVLYEKIFIAFYGELCEKYFSLRKSVLTFDHIRSLFSVKMRKLDEKYFQGDFEKWEEADWHGTLDELPIDSFSAELDYILAWTEDRLLFCDGIFGRKSLTFDSDGILYWD